MTNMKASRRKVFVFRSAVMTDKWARHRNNLWKAHIGPWRYFWLYWSVRHDCIREMAWPRVEESAGQISGWYSYWSCYSTLGPRQARHSMGRQPSIIYLLRGCLELATSQFGFTPMTRSAFWNSSAEHNIVGHLAPRNVESFVCFRFRFLKVGSFSGSWCWVILND